MITNDIVMFIYCHFLYNYLIITTSIFTFLGRETLLTVKVVLVAIIAVIGVVRNSEATPNYGNHPRGGEK